MVRAANKTGLVEFLTYVAISAGMTLASSGFSIFSELAGRVRGAQLAAAILIAGLVCLVIAASIAELAGMYPTAPGVRTYLRAAFGDVGSLTATMAVLVMVVLFAGVESYVLSLSLGQLFPRLDVKLGAQAILVVVVCVNLLGFQLSSRLQLVLTIFLVGFLALTAVVGLSVAPAPGAVVDSAAVTTGWGALTLFGGVGTALFLFMGFEWVTPLGRGPKAYQRAIPWSMIAALIVLIGLYVGFGATLERHLPSSRLLGVDTPHLGLGQALWSRAGIPVMVAVSVVATVTTFNAGLLGASRLVYALAREGVLPKLLTTLSLRTGTPIAAIAAIGLAAVAATSLENALGAHRIVALVTAALYGFIYGAFTLAALRMRALRPDAVRPFRTHVPPVVQVLVAIALPICGVLALVEDRAAAGSATATLAAALAVSFGAALLLRRRPAKAPMTFEPQGVTRHG